VDVLMATLHAYAPCPMFCERPPSMVNVEPVQ
jgi:hypothetical protein